MGPSLLARVYIAYEVGATHRPALRSSTHLHCTPYWLNTHSYWGTECASDPRRFGPVQRPRTPSQLAPRYSPTQGLARPSTRLPTLVPSHTIGGKEVTEWKGKSWSEYGRTSCAVVEKGGFEKVQGTIE